MLSDEKLLRLAGEDAARLRPDALHSVFSAKRGVNLTVAPVCVGPQIITFKSYMQELKNMNILT